MSGTENQSSIFTEIDIQNVCGRTILCDSVLSSGTAHHVRPHSSPRRCRGGYLIAIGQHEKVHRHLNEPIVRARGPRSDSVNLQYPLDLQGEDAEKSTCTTCAIHKAIFPSLSQ